MSTLYLDLSRAPQGALTLMKPPLAIAFSVTRRIYSR